MAKPFDPIARMQQAIAAAEAAKRKQQTALSRPTERAPAGGVASAGGNGAVHARYASPFMVHEIRAYNKVKYNKSLKVSSINRLLSRFSLSLSVCCSHLPVLRRTILVTRLQGWSLR